MRLLQLSRRSHAAATIIPLLIWISTNYVAGIHESMNEKELHHIFGVRLKEQVGPYDIIHPKRTSSTSSSPSSFSSSTSSSSSSSSFSSDHPRQQQQQHLIHIEIDGEEHVFRLEPNHRDLFSLGFHSVISQQTGADNQTEAVEEEQDLGAGNSLLNHCVYQGKSIYSSPIVTNAVDLDQRTSSHSDYRRNRHLYSNQTSTISLVGCGNQLRGLIATPSDHYLLHPVPRKHLKRVKRSTDDRIEEEREQDSPKNNNNNNSDTPHPHILLKHGQSQYFTMGAHAESMEKPCLFNAKDDPFPNADSQEAGDEDPFRDGFNEEEEEEVYEDSIELIPPLSPLSLGEGEGDEDVIEYDEEDEDEGEDEDERNPSLKYSEKRNNRRILNSNNDSDKTPRRRRITIGGRRIDNNNNNNHNTNGTESLRRRRLIVSSSSSSKGPRVLKSIGRRHRQKQQKEEGQRRRRPHQYQRLPIRKGGPLIIELGVFADDAMWKHFRELYDRDAESELQQFILAAVNNIHHLYSHDSIDPKINLKITRYQVMKSPPTLITKRAHRNGEVDLLLEGFCQHQHDINPSADSNPRHWDHALLFSGYDLYRGGLKSVAGYAPVKGMCSGIRSCTINEGLDFGAVFVITHEMGHSLGMYHDGDNGCSSRCCVMSPSVGTGKTSWSTCSVTEFNTFVNKLGTGFLPTNCLLDGQSERGTILDHSLRGFLPGQRYNLDQQCRIFHGDCWKHELRDGQAIADVCQMVWCGAGEGVIRTTHPALEGTYCGPNNWCIGGKCQRWIGSSSIPRAINGAWTAWNDNPESSCGGGKTGCTKCEIGNQIRVRRSVRLCENPAPNNGGQECKGSAYRAVLCTQERCKGPLPDQFATRVCTELRNNQNTPDLLLSGKGFQYEESPCKVWCHMTLNNFIRSVANFPDGTPCAQEKFCVKGQCQALDCRGNALVEDATDCPDSASPSASASPRKPQAKLDRLRNRIRRPAPKPTPQPSKKGRWTKWTSWTDCSVSCGKGTKKRRRTCVGRLCLGISRQELVCHQPQCITRISLSNNGGSGLKRRSNWGAWESWRPCDVTCGSGRQLRGRKCQDEDSKCSGLRFQYRRCDLANCVKFDNDNWSSWESWTKCSRTCGGGVRIRRRECLQVVCIGKTTQTTGCSRIACSNDEEKAKWSTWTEWSACSRVCGGGTRFRTRKCDGKGVCFGSSVSFTNCNTIKCKDKLPKKSRNTAATDVEKAGGDTFSKWATWQSWSSCSRSCGGGVQKRKRSCKTGFGSPCRGISSQTRSCNSQRCDRRAAGGGVWSGWGEWTPCDCSQRRQSRYRRCNRRPPCFGRWIVHRFCRPGSTNNNC